MQANDNQGIQQLKDRFNGQFSESEDDRHVYGTDWSRPDGAYARLVIFPHDHQDVVDLVAICRRFKIAIIASGGRTGLSGAACALANEVVVSFERMNTVLHFYPDSLSILCQAGCITEHIQQVALQHGYYFPIDFGARGSSQIGGNIATNAGGLRVLKYGSMRSWVGHIKVVCGNGETLELGRGLIKNATGYDLLHTFIGSEGTLGLITEAEVRLTQKPQQGCVLLLALSELSALMAIYRLFRDHAPLSLFEYFSQSCLNLVLQHNSLTSPIATESEHFLLVEMEAAEDQVLEAFEKGLDKGWILDGLLAQTSEQIKEFFYLREGISEAAAAFQPYKNDISVRLEKIPDLLEGLKTLKGLHHGFEVLSFGHIGDGNIHVNILKPQDMERGPFLNHCHQVNLQLFELIHKLGGSVSAEHGVGLVKKPYLHYTRSPAEVTLMKELKKVFDPTGILNPGKIFDP